MSAENLIDTQLSPSGRAVNPGVVPTVGVMDPNPKTRYKGQGPSIYKGETIRFCVGPVPRGKVHKLTVGWAISGKLPLFQGYALNTTDNRGVTMALTALDTSRMISGIYLWDVFEVSPNGDASLVSCGSFNLKETVGGLQIKNDPTIAAPRGEDAIPTLLTRVETTVTPAAGEALALDSLIGEFESIEGVWYRVASMQLILSGEADGGDVSMNFVDENEVEVIPQTSVSAGDTEGPVVDLSDSLVKLEVGKTYSGKLTEVTGLGADISATLVLEFAVSQG